MINIEILTKTLVVVKMADNDYDNDYSIVGNIYYIYTYIYMS